ncbi:MAG: signal recognition particle-docking protein FtsY [Candidatus Edwardsbacteria bacterium]|jgi:fused signal recognition particle receptor|nr:signal recognition particle-docking protein FtsY [Candidatus Edwardsbacteria bacterium]
MSLLGSIRDSLAKTRAGLFGAVAAAVSGKRALSPDELAALEERLLLADVGLAATERLLAAVREGPADQDAAARLRAGMRAVLDGAPPAREDGAAAAGPRVWLIAGVNGSGKTTSAGKLSHLLRSAGRAVMLAAADTYRAAAAEQLRLWADRTGADFIGSRPGADPAGVAFDAVSAAAARGSDVLLVDTAGRLHTQRHLRDELAKVRSAIAKRLPGAPHRTLLVLDGTAGQNGLSQARLFSEAVPIDGIILTKLDGTAKGGVVLAIAEELKIPVAYVGTGEGPGDLRPFDAGEFVDGLIPRTADGGA